MENRRERNTGPAVNLESSNARLTAKGRQAPHTLGTAGEEAAVRYLKKKKYRVVVHNFRFHRGEIDLIAYDRKTLVFFEVKTRRSLSFGLPEESVTPAKQRQIRKIAEAYLLTHNLRDVPCRFDILSVSFDERIGLDIRHFENAF